MAGETIDLFSRRTFVFTDMGANKTQQLVLETSVGVEAWTSGLLEMRVHSTTMPSGSTVELRLYTTAPTSEDPARDFVVATAAATASLAAADTAPKLCPGALSANFGSELRAVLVATTTGTTGTFVVELSARLSVKD